MKKVRFCLVFFLLLLLIPQHAFAGSPPNDSISGLDARIYGDSVQQYPNEEEVFAGKKFEITALVTFAGDEPHELARVEAEVDGVKTTLTYYGIYDSRDCHIYNCRAWKGSFDMGALAKGEKKLIIRAVELNGESTERAIPFYYHEAPTLQIEEPADYTAALPYVKAKASCIDDRGFVCRVKVESTERIDTYQSPISSTPYFRQIDTDISLEKNAKYLKFTALDSIGRSVVQYRRVFPELISSHIDTLASFQNGLVLDAQPSLNRALSYNAALKKLELHDLAAGTKTVLPTAFSEIPSAYLTPHGAIYEYKPAGASGYELAEWRDGSLVDLGGVNASSLKVKGSYAIFTKYVDATQGNQLFLRNLVTAVNETIGSAAYVTPEETNLADNGTVVFSLTQPGNRNVMLYSGGILKKLTQDTSLTNGRAITDGSNVLFLKGENLVEGSHGTLMLVKSDGSASELAARVDHFVMNDGWIAYRSISPDDASLLRVVSPDGVQQPVTQQTTFMDVIAVGSNGDVMFGTAHYYLDYQKDLYISRLEDGIRTETRLSTTNITPFWDQDSWYGRIGNSLVMYRVPEDGEAPTWPAGSRVTVEGDVWSWPAAQDNVGVDQYRIHINGQIVAELPGNTLTYTADWGALSRFGSGSIYLSAVDAAGNDSLTFSNFLNITDNIGNFPPYAPGSLQTTAVTENSVSLAWTYPAGEPIPEKYAIFMNKYLVAEVPGDTTSYTVQNLPAETDFTFRVEAGNAYGYTTSGPTATVRTTLDAELPTWPAGSTLQAVYLNQYDGINIQLSWPAAEDNQVVTKYKIYMNGMAAYEVDAKARTYPIYRLEPETTYTFKVEARDAVGNWSTTGPTLVFTTRSYDMTPPTWPAGSKATSGGTTTQIALISWTAAADNVGVARYRIIHGTTELASVDANTRTRGIEGLTPNTTYVLKVEACDGAGNCTTDGPSVTVTTLKTDGTPGTPTDTFAPTWPSGSQATSGGTTTAIALISWTAAADDVGVTGYRIINGTAVVAETDGNTRTKGITGLNSARTYTFTIEARDAAGNWSSGGPSVTVTTLPRAE
ncbi:fibronectin type III domain-containing protein [Paenibacillus xanthanilyticus]|uniref:Fibronectin type III domain-containing protein n=1 Tax=Paenibacillus xanthanilyticus TaxID=1783531 RepID=A0ABV8JXW9_9BACL